MGNKARDLPTKLKTVRATAIFDTLQQNTATLHNQLWLPDGSGAAIWSNQNGQAKYCKPSHHTLSFYLEGGQHTHRVYNRGTPLYGAPDKLCLMPAEHQSQWRFESRFSFLHLYFEQAHLQNTMEKAFDKEGRYVELLDETFVDDPFLRNLFHHTLLPLNWQDNADKLAFTHLLQLVYIHLLKQHCHIKQADPKAKGGLAPFIGKRVTEYIHAHLEFGMTIEQLAQIAGLSEFHFSRMFQQSFGLPPHQYVLRQRIEKAKQLLEHSHLPIADIALQCGFSSQPHLTRQFKHLSNTTPAKYRQLIHHGRTTSI